jgi:FMN-dependent oxidoreductase (nitrilotriacetate monooxygenase family)
VPIDHKSRIRQQQGRIEAVGKMMHLGTILLGTGSHVGGWRMPEAQFGSQNLPLIQHVAQVVERGKFDFVFFADAVSTTPELHPGMRVRLEPLTLLAALSMSTSRVGLVATVSTTYSQPYNVARAFASIDHMSQGRAGWNVVTSTGEEAAGNFGLEKHPSHAQRYEMAQEYVDVTKGLWDSWEDGALVGNKTTGVYTDNSKLHPLNHEGAYYKVKGPLNITRSPQAYPVFFQAGASDRGIEFAAATAEVVFTAQQIPEEALDFAKRLRGAVEAVGRAPDSVKILCGVCPIIADSKEEAREQVARLGALLDPDSAMKVLSDRLGYDMRDYPLDERVPDLPLSAAGTQGHARQLFSIARREKLTLRQLRDFAAASSGHRLILGTPTEIADDLEAWFKSGATEGFAIMSPYLPGPIERFVAEVVPILVERGLFRSDYEGTTLRDHLGLPRPSHPAALRA